MKRAKMNPDVRKPAVLLTICLALERKKTSLAKACGMYRPGNINLNVFKDSTKEVPYTHEDPFQFGTVSWMENFKSTYMIDVFGAVIYDLSDLLTTASSRADACCLDPLCVASLRITNWIMRNTCYSLVFYEDESCISTRTNGPNNRNQFKQCAQMLYHSLFALFSDKHLHDENDAEAVMVKHRHRAADLVVRTLNFVQYANTKAPHSNRCVLRYRFLDQVFANRKKVTYKAMSDFVTVQNMQAPLDLKRRVEPDVNYVRDLAVHELLLHGMTKLTTGELVTLNEMLDKCETVYPDLLLNSDHLHLATAAFKMGRALLTVKLMEVNRRSCSCQTKCFGPVGRQPSIQESMLRSLEVNSSIMICGECRMCFSIETPNKARRTFSSITPETQSCSNDGCSTVYVVKLVHNDVYVEEQDKEVLAIYVRFSHRFYATSIVDLVWEMTQGKQGKKGGSSQLYGMCYGGFRTCKKRITFTANKRRRKKKPGSHTCTSDAANSKYCKDSNKDQKGEDLCDEEPYLPPYCNTDSWYRCQQCRLQSPLHDGQFGMAAALSLGLVSHEQGEDTCLTRWFYWSPLSERENHVETYAISDPGQLCRGCKMAALCSHMEIELAKSTQSKRHSVKSLLFKMKKMITLRKYLYSGKDIWL